MKTFKNLVLLALTVLLVWKQAQVDNLKEKLESVTKVISTVDVPTSDPAWSVCWSNTVSHPIGLVHGYETKDGAHRNELWPIVEPQPEPQPATSTSQTTVGIFVSKQF